MGDNQENEVGKNEEADRDKENTTLFSTAARLDFDPFEVFSEISAKFVRIGPDELRKWADANDVKIDPELSEKGAIFFGPSGHDHWVIVCDNLGLDAQDQANRVKIREEMKFADSGMIFLIDGEEHRSAGIPNVGSGELKSEEGKDFFRLANSPQLYQLHIDTANILNEIYDNEQSRVKIKFEVPNLPDN